MTAKRHQAEHGAAQKGNDAAVGPVAGELSDLDEVGAPATDSDFTRLQFWFLRQVAVDRPHKLAVEVALVYADHANRKTGLTYPSQSTIARILGVQPRSVRSCIKALVDGKHLIFDCWIRPNNSIANVKAYRLNAHDRRVAKRFDTKALGLGTPGKILPGEAPGAVRDTRQDFAGSGHAVTKSHPAKYRRAPGKVLSSTRQDIADKPSEEPSDRTDSSGDATFKAFREAAKSGGVALGPGVKKNWVADLAELVGLGLELDAHVLPVLEYWGGKLGRLTDLQGDAEEVRCQKWVHDAANEFRIPADVAWSDHVGEMVELFQRAGWRPIEHGQLFAGCAALVEDDFPCFDEIDQAVELMLQANSTPTAPSAADELIDRYQVAQAGIEHPDWSFETFAAAVARFPSIALGRHFRRRWEQGCADMASEGLDFERHVVPSIAYCASVGHGSAAVLRDGYDVRFWAERVHDLSWLRTFADPGRIPDGLPIRKCTRRAYELFQLAGWRPTEHPDVFATFNDLFRSGPFADCWHTVEFAIATNSLPVVPVPMANILAAHERNREKILAWRAEGEFEDDLYRATELPIDPRVEARL